MLIEGASLSSGLLDDPSPLLIAYLDLGTGSLILQMLIAGVLGAAVTMRRLRTYVVFKVRSLFAKKPAAALSATDATSGAKPADGPPRAP